MTHFAGVTCFGKQADNADAGLITIVDAPGSETQIGNATHYADWTGRVGYQLKLKGKEKPEPGLWRLEDGQFRQAKESA